MIRGTTAQFQFKLPYQYDNLSLVKITFWQPGNNGPASNRTLPIVKILEQCDRCDYNNGLSVILTEEETLRFSDATKAYVQLRGKTVEGTCFANKPQAITVYPVYDDAILDEEIMPSPDFDGWVYLDGGIVE